MSVKINHVQGDKSLPVDMGLYTIRYDDTIIDVKKKIILAAASLNAVVPEEIYLFAKIEKKISSEQIFDELTKSRGKFSRVSGKDMNVLKINYEMEKMKTDQLRKQFNYKDFKQEFKQLFDKNIRDTIPLGHSIVYKGNYAFVTNPYKLVINADNKENDGGLTWDTVLVAENNNKNLINYSDTKLLLEFLDPNKDNEIYVCTASKFWEYMPEEGKIHRKDDFYKYILQIYFPKLFYIQKIYDYTSLPSQQKFKVDDKLKGTAFTNLNKFYEYNNDAKNKDGKITGNISSINFDIHTIKKIQIPMDLIFKILHSGEEIPMIKYNPGKRRDNIFRLYTKDYFSDTGLKLPYLYVEENFKHFKIKNIDKQIAKSDSLGIYICYNKEKTYTQEIYCELYSNGRINVKMEDIIAVGRDLEEDIKSKLNDLIIGPINKFIKKSGFNYPMFNTLTDPNIEIKNIKYRYTIKGFPKRKRFKLTAWKTAINTIFSVPRTDFATSGRIEFYYIKVSSYVKSNALEAYILNYRQEYGLTEDEKLVELLIDNNLVTDKQEAIDEITKSEENLALNINIYSSKKIDIRDSPGFKVTLFKDLNNTIIEYENINNYNYLEHIDIYTNYLWHNLLNKTKGESKEILKGFDRKIPKFKYNPDPKNEEIQEQEKEKMEDMGKQMDVGHYHVEEEEDSGSDSEDSDSEDDSGDDTDDDFFQGGGDSDSDTDTDSDDGIYGNLDDIQLKGINNYFINRISSNEPHLFVKRGKAGKTFSFARSCPSTVGKSPILITKDEKKKIDDLDANNKTRSYDEYITSENGNHYICPRFWCLSDKNAQQGRSLSFQQVNDGECGGWDSIIGKNENPSDTKRIYEFTDEKYHEGFEGNDFIYKQHYPGWLKKNVDTEDGQGKEEICIPCCYSSPRTNYKAEEWEKIGQTDEEKNEYNTKEMNKKFPYWETAPQTFQRKRGKGELPGVGKKKINHTIEGKEIKKYDKVTLMSLDENSGYRRNRANVAKSRQKMYGKCDKEGRPKEEDINVGKTIEFMSTPIIESFPVKTTGQFGYLPLNVQKFFNYNNITECWTSSKSSKMKVNKWCLLRMGMEKNNLLLGCIGNIFQYYKDIGKNKNKGQEINIQETGKDKGDENTGVERIINWVNFYEETIIITPVKGKLREELDVRRPDIDKLYNPSEKVLNNFVKMNKGNLYQMFKKKKKYKDDDDGIKQQKKDAIINFMKFMTETKGKDDKDYEIFWDIITSPKKAGGCFFEDGVNLIILKKPKDDIENKIEVICPNNNFYKHAYDENKLTIILYTENNKYEPIYMVKRPQLRSKKIWRIKKMFDNFSDVNGNSKFEKTIKHIMKEANIHCKKSPSMENHKFEENDTLNELLDFNEKKREYVKPYSIKNHQVLEQLYNEDYQVIAVVLGTGEGKFALPCYPSAIMYDIKKDRYEGAISKYLLDMETTKKHVNYFKLRLVDGHDEDVMSNGKIVGLRTNTNQVILIGPRDITDGKIDVELEEYNLDKLILSNYPDQDKERIKNMKKIKLETNFYMMYRNLFKIFINKSEYREEKKKIITILDGNKESYLTKFDAIQEQIYRVINKHIIFQEIDFENLNLDELIDCLDLNDKDCDGVTCCTFKDETCKYIFPIYNLMYYPDNEIKSEDIYKKKVADEILRYSKIREYILNNDSFLNFDKIEYQINDDEIVIIENMFYQIYVHDIPYINHSDYINNYRIYDNVNQENMTKKYKRTFTLPPFDSEEEESISEDDNQQGAIEEKRGERGDEEPSKKKAQAKPKKKAQAKPKKKVPSKEKSVSVAKKGEGPPYYKDKGKKFMSFYLWKEYLLHFYSGLLLTKFKEDEMIKTIVNIKMGGTLGSRMKQGGIQEKWAKSTFKKFLIPTKKLKDREMRGPEKWESDILSKFKDGAPFQYNGNNMKAVDHFLDKTEKRHFDKTATVKDAIDAWWENCCTEGGRKDGEIVTQLINYWKL